MLNRFTKHQQAIVCAVSLCYIVIVTEFRNDSDMSSVPQEGEKMESKIASGLPLRARIRTA